MSKKTFSIAYLSCLMAFSLPLSFLPSYSADNDNSSSSLATTANSTSNSAKPAKKMLYGRLEEIVEKPGAKFPITLQAQTAKLDTRVSNKSQQAEATMYSGQIVKSFPQQFNGTWGGTLKIWTSQIDSPLLASRQC